MSLLSYSKPTCVKNDETTLSVSSESSTELELEQSRPEKVLPKRSVSFPNGL